MEERGVALFILILSIFCVELNVCQIINSIDTIDLVSGHFYESKNITRSQSVFHNYNDNFICNKNYQKGDQQILEDIGDRKNIFEKEKIVNGKVKKANNDFVFGIWNDFHTLFLPRRNATKQCLHDTKQLLFSLNNKELWALKMIDATAKIPSGLLNGNVNQFGDFDECLSIRRPVVGKYFLAALDISMVELGFTDELDSLVHSHRWIKSNITDPGHRVPRVSTIYWGICLPSSCSAEDLQNTLKDQLKALCLQISVDEKLSVTYEKTTSYSTGKIVTLIMFGLLITVISVGTLYTPQSLNNRRDKILIGFSLQRNVKKITDTSLKGEVRGVDGVRALNALALLLSHKSMALFFNPYVNRTSMAEIFAMPWAVIGRTAIIYTDSFLLVSGFLTVRSLLKDVERTGRMNFPEKLITRLFRILPSLICIILFCTYILPDLGNGPQWEMVITEHSRLCKKNMWKNFLFIHNFWGFENMCLTHTHQVGIDMQLFLFTPIALGLLRMSGSKGCFSLVIIAIISSGLRYRVSIAKEISMIVYYGMSVTKFFESANFSYILPAHRLTIYLMGVGLAYFMSKKISHIYLSRLQASVGWIVALNLGLWAMIGPWHMGLKTYEYDSFEAAIYSALSPVSWGTFICWSIWACSNGCAGWFGDFLSWRGFRIFSKIAYGVYLTQFPVFFYNVGIQKYAGYYKPHMMFNIPEVGFILAVSTVIALCVEIPFNNLCRILMENTKNTSGISEEINESIEKSECPGDTTKNIYDKNISD